MAIKKIKKLTLLLGVALTLLAPLIGASAVFTGRASAVVAPETDSGSGSKSDSANTGDRAAAWVLARSVGACLYNINYPDISISSSDFTKGNWGLPSANPSLNLGEYTGVLVEGPGSDDGKVKCDKTIAAAVSALHLDATTTLCDMGFTRQHGGSDCTTGTGDFIPPSSMHSSDDAFGEAWDNFILSDYFGITVADPSSKAQITAAYENAVVLTDGMRYYIYSMEFKQGCGNGRGGGWSIKPWSNQTLDNQSYHLQWLDTSSNTITEDFVSSSKNTKSIDVTVDGNKLLDQMDFGGSSKCNDVANAMNKYADAYTAAAAEDQQEGKVPSTTSPTGTTGVDCGGWNWEDVATLTISWITCPIIKGAAHLAGVLEDQIDAMLYINTDQIFCENDNNPSQCSATSSSFEQAWNVVRIFALGLLGIAGLLMILSQGLGFEIFDAYTIKKTLPRILVAAIGITLSWRLLYFIVTLSNDLGVGIRSLMYAPFQGTANQLVLGGGAKALGAIFSIGGFLALGVLGGLSFILTALVAILLAFFTLVIRNVLVILLLILAPLAIAAYILPNTEKYWKTWWNWFFRALLAFPIITAIIAAGHIFAGVTSTGNQSTLNSVVAFFAYFAPYFLIPAAFRMAGGALATLSGMANDRSRGVFDRLKNYRQGQMQKNWNDMKSGNRFHGGTANNFRGKINRGLAGAINAPGAIDSSGNLFKPSQWVAATRSAMGSHELQEVDRNLQENAAYQGWKNNDGLNKAAFETNNASELKTFLLNSDNQKKYGWSYRDGDRDLDETINNIETVRRSMSGPAFKAMTQRQANAGGTVYKSADGQPKTAAGEWLADIARASRDSEALAGKLVAEERGEAVKAGRIDLGGASFGATITTVNDMRRELQKTGTISQATIEAATRKIHQSVYVSQGGGSLVHPSMKPDAVKEMVPEILNDVQMGKATGDREFTQSLASLAAVYDGMQSTNPTNAKIMADQVFSQTFDVGSLSNAMKSRLQGALLQPDGSYKYSGTITYQQAIDAMRGNSEFKEMRREYANEIDRRLGQPNPAVDQAPGSPFGD